MTDVRINPADTGDRGSTTVRSTPSGSAPTSPGRGPAVPRIDRRDPRYLALRNFAISMSIFNILGYTVLGFEQPWAWPFFALLVGYSVEFGAETIAAWANRRPAAYSGNGVWGVYTFMLPTHITALAANMLLYANDMFWPIAFGVAVAVGQKYVLQAPIKGRMRHFMNPSNFGITATLLAFSWVNIAPPYQFTERVPDVISIVIPLIIVTAGTVLNAMLTKKVLLIMGWVGSFVIQALVRHWVWDVALWAALAPITGVAFVLFTNYMVTDPGTSPSAGRHQFMFGASVGTVYGVLMFFNVVYTLFFAVTIVCLIRGAYWWIRWLAQGRQHVAPDARPQAVASAG
ncbi:enediyne biosynthesis protein [Dactylosporangium sp. NPDC051484]|uniref:enediyne biosynthesis protein n=1 Tax=Dactylosporangium sp. NPDC051484 TaxID=3154942 RepID=UPI00344D3BBF